MKTSQVAGTIPLMMIALCSFATEPVGEWVHQIVSANKLLESRDLNLLEVLYTTALQQAESIGDDLRAAVVPQNLGRLLDRRVNVLHAEKAFLCAMNALTRSAVKDDGLRVPASVELRDQASLLGSLGVIMAHQGRFEQVEQLLLKTAELCQRAFATERKEVRIAFVNMAGIQMRGGRTVEASASYRHELGMMESLAHPYPVTLAVRLADYAGVLLRMGDGTARKACTAER